MFQRSQSEVAPTSTISLINSEEKEEMTLLAEIKEEPQDYDEMYMQMEDDDDDDDDDDEEIIEEEEEEEEEEDEIENDIDGEEEINESPAAKRPERLEEADVPSDVKYFFFFKFTFMF